MKLLERYLWKNVLLSVLVTWLSLSLLFALFDFLAELNDTKTGTRYGALQAFLYVVYSLPRTLYENFPYAALIGSLMGLGNLAANSEVTAMRAAGFSIRQIVVTTLKLGLILSLLVFALGEWGVPRAEAYAENFKIRMLQQELSISEEGVWLKNGKQLIHIDKVWSSTKVDGLAIYEIDEQAGGIGRILKATSAERQGESWYLQKVVDQRLSKSGVVLTQYEQLTLGDILPANILNLATVTPEQLAARELAQFIQHQRDNALNTDRFELEYWKHFTTPLSTLVMLVLAAPLVFGFQRNAGAGQRIFIGILIGITYLLLDRIIGRTGLVYGLPPLLSAILPMLLFSALGLFMLGRVR